MLFKKEEYQQRLIKVQKMMHEKGIELLISHDTNNINYLTGYDAWSFYYAQCAIVHIKRNGNRIFIYTQSQLDETIEDMSQEFEIIIADK